MTRNIYKLFLLLIAVSACSSPSKKDHTSDRTSKDGSINSRATEDPFETADRLNKLKSINEKSGAEINIECYNTPFINVLKKASYCRKLSKLKTAIELLKKQNADTLTSVAIHGWPQYSDLTTMYYIGHETFERDLIDHYKAHRFTVQNTQKTAPEKQSYTQTSYAFDVICKSDSIIYCKLSTMTYYRKDNKWLPIQVTISSDSTTELTKLKKGYQNELSYKLTTAEVFSNSFVYSSHCGITGQQPYERIFTERLIEKKDTTYIYAWLNSPVPEKQLYAIEAVFTLEKQNFLIPSTVTKRIYKLSKSNSTVQICSGCINTSSTVESCYLGIAEKFEK